MGECYLLDLLLELIDLFGFISERKSSTWNVLLIIHQVSKKFSSCGKFTIYSFLIWM